MNEDQLQRFPAGVAHLRCANAGPMTLSGTNTYVVGLSEPCRAAAHVGIPGPVERPPLARVAVIDPGPDTEGDAAAHREAVVAVVRAIGIGVEATAVDILLTHHHADHTGGVEELVTMLREAGASVEVHGGGMGNPLKGGERFSDLVTVAASGHTRDSVVFVLDRDGVRVLFTGDTVLGEGSSFVAYPDGDLTDYLETLDVLHTQADVETPTVLAPGHGPVGADALPVIDEYREHRAERLGQVRDVVHRVGDDADRETLVTAVVDTVYADVGLELRPAVEAVVRAQVVHLTRD